MTRRDGVTPYRSPDALPAAGEAPATLGPRVSSHYRNDLQGAVARVLRWSPAVELHEGGIVLLRGTPEHVEILFDDVDAVFYDYESALPQPSPRVTLVTEDARRAEIPRDLSGLDQVLAALHREVTRPVVLRAVEALKRGEAMTFGALGIELDGMRLRGEEVLAWEQLAQVVVDWDTIVIHGREPIGRFGWVPIRDVPHPHALLAVLRMRGDVVLYGRTADPGAVQPRS